VADCDLAEFVADQARLKAIAYRMLGSSADAEDVVQEAFLRWRERRDRDVDSSPSYLATIVVRLCIDHLRSARVRRESYVGPWLPEPVLVEEVGPAEAAELADTLSVAFLVLLEELAPVERAAFLLHDVFGYPYEELASMLDRQPATCRQLVSRARQRVAKRRHRFDADKRAGRELAERFLNACATGDVKALLDTLAEDVIVWTDGGGKVRAALNPIYGASKSARFLVAIAHDLPPTAQTRPATVNGQPGYIIVVDAAVTAALSLEIISGRIVGVRAVTNPEKLAHLTV
jgi:RNA polymerase sigma-70 factor (ECF subfamily)